MAAEGGSAREKAETLRRLAAGARLKADRMDTMAQRWEAGELARQLPTGPDATRIVRR